VCVRADPGPTLIIACPCRGGQMSGVHLIFPVTMRVIETR